MRPSFFCRKMKLLSALVLGGAMLTSGCVQKEVEVDESPEEASKQDTDRKISNDELQNRGGFWYVKGETYRFSGIAVSAENQSRLETPYISSFIPLTVISNICMTTVLSCH